jgi:hypothetical protein
MTGNTTPTITDYRGDVVRLACSKCDRRGQYRKAALIKRYGGSTKLPDLLAEIARCAKAGSMSDGCGVYFVELAKS